MKKRSKQKLGTKQKKVRLDLSCVDLDSIGHVIISDPELAAGIKKARELGLEFVYLSANEGDFCVLPSGCPVTGHNVGCGCPTIKQ